MAIAELRKDSKPTSESTARLLRELVSHLADNRTQLREEWIRRITEARLLQAMTNEEIFAEATSVYDTYVEALKTRTLETLQAYAQNLSERIIPRGVDTDEVVGIVLLLRDVLARSLFSKYQSGALNDVLDTYEPAANAIAITVAVGFVRERERIIREQQEAIRELSTPVLQVRERLLILPIIGLIDPLRARQLTEQLLARDSRQPREGRGHRHHRRRGHGRRGRQSLGAHRGVGAPAGGARDRHGAVTRDRPNTREHRCGPREDEHGGRSPGGHRGGRALAGIQGDASGRAGARLSTHRSAPGVRSR